MKQVNVVRKYLSLSKIFPGFLFSFLLAIYLELFHFLFMLLAGIVAGIFIKKGWISFIIGFISVSLAWTIYFIIFAIIGPISELFSLFQTIMGLNGLYLMFLSIILGGLLGGSGALIGGYAIQLILGDDFDPKKKTTFF